MTASCLDTNEGGEIFFYDLEPGTYLVKEIATDDGHVVNSTPQQIELKAGETQTREPKEKPSTLENRAKLGVTPYGNGWPGIRARWCTGQLKTHLINKEVNRLKKEKNALHYVGIAADEPARIKDGI